MTKTRKYIILTALSGFLFYSCGTTSTVTKNTTDEISEDVIESISIENETPEETDLTETEEPSETIEPAEDNSKESEEPEEDKNEDFNLEDYILENIEIQPSPEFSPDDDLIEDLIEENTDDFDEVMVDKDSLPEIEEEYPEGEVSEDSDESENADETDNDISDEVFDEMLEETDETFQLPEDYQAENFDDIKDFYFEPEDEIVESYVEEDEIEDLVDETPHVQLSRNIAGFGVLTAEQLTEFFLFNNPDEDYARVLSLAQIYIEEASMEGINWDVAFIQMCHETGFLRFGNLVTPEMHNYCGLGAIDINHRGESFATEQLGVRAHIQHLHAYATTEDQILQNQLIDNRYKWVKPRGKATTIYELTGTWATDSNYATKIETFMAQIEELFTVY